MKKLFIICSFILVISSCNIFGNLSHPSYIDCFTDNSFVDSLLNEYLNIKKRSPYTKDIFIKVDNDYLTPTGMSHPEMVYSFGYFHEDKIYKYNGRLEVNNYCKYLIQRTNRFLIIGNNHKVPLLFDFDSNCRYGAKIYVTSPIIKTSELIAIFRDSIVTNYTIDSLGDVNSMFGRTFIKKRDSWIYLKR